jgi:hypothetical protein
LLAKQLIPGVSELLLGGRGFQQPAIPRLWFRQMLFCFFARVMWRIAAVTSMPPVEGMFSPFRCGYMGDTRGLKNPVYARAESPSRNVSLQWRHNSPS